MEITTIIQAFSIGIVDAFPIRPINSNSILRFNPIKNCWEVYNNGFIPSLEDLNKNIWEILKEFKDSDYTNNSLWIPITF